MEIKEIEVSELSRLQIIVESGNINNDHLKSSERLETA